MVTHYMKKIDENGNILGLQTSKRAPRTTPFFIEITEEEYCQIRMERAQRKMTKIEIDLKDLKGE